MSFPLHPDPDDPRTRHFGTFYGLDDRLAGEAGAAHQRQQIDHPVTLVVGNCQAESLRIMLDAGDLTTVRMPAVHELTASDMPYLEHWLERTDLLVAQPVRDDYHSLPLGTRQLAERLPPFGRVVRIPVVRFAGLYPTSAIVRPPADPGMTPPVVEYHDLRLLALAAGGPELPALDSRRVRSVATASTEQLQRREAANETVILSDLFDRPDFDQMRTLNHPGNSVWTAAAARVRAAAGLQESPVDPGRPLLDSVHAPREAAVIAAFDLDDEPRAQWIVAGVDISADEVKAAHLRWYRDHPDVVAAGVARHADTLRVLAA